MKQKKFEATLKKSVTMFNMLTGRDLTEREGSAFIQIFDLVDDYTGTGGDAVETFDVLSQAQTDKPGLRETPAAKELQALDIPTLAHLAGEKHVPRTEVNTDPASPDGDRTARVTVDSTPSSPWLDRKLKGVAVNHAVLESMAKAESAEHGKPLGGIVELAKQAEVDAAWQSRDQEQAEESEHVEQELRHRADTEKASQYVDTNGRDKHPVGYDWQVCALCREGSRENSTIRCYKSEPTPEEFFELYRLYDAHSHWVFINRWNACAQRWEKFLDDYLEQHEQAIRNLRGTLPPRVVKVSKDPEGLAVRDVSAPPMSDPWEEADKPWRIRYYSDVMQRVIFSYIDKKPTGAEMAHFHHTKCLAVSQARPKQ